MVREIIESIKQTEAKAAALVEEAKQKKAEIIARAREEARKSVEEARKQGAERVKQALQDAQQDVEAKVAEIARQEAEKQKLVREASSANISKAVDLTIERMLK